MTHEPALDPGAVNITVAYRKMAEVARYRPAAPSDGFGHITVPLEQLDLGEEALAYARRWRTEENRCEFWIGCTDFTTARATVYAVEAARNLCGHGVGAARRLLQMALAELDTDEVRQSEERIALFLGPEG